MTLRQATGVKGLFPNRKHRNKSEIKMAAKSEIKMAAKSGVVLDWAALGFGWTPTRCHVR